MLKNKKLLIISPHPDDEAICSGGLIMKAKQEGAFVFVFYMAVGQSRQFHNPKRQTYVNERLSEVKKACKYGNFKYEIFSEKATRLDTLPQKDLIEGIEDRTRLFKPDIVVLPYRNSFNQDHRAVARAAITAFRPLPNTLHPQPKMILEMEEPYSWPTSFTPNFYIDISDLFDEKIALYQCHATQVPSDPFPRSVENLRRLAGIRGCEIGSKYAEGYNLIKGQL